MGCCCCGESDAPRRQQPPPPPPRGFRTTAPLNAEPSQCEYCHMRLDPCLLDGHRETCRTNVRRRMQQQQQHQQHHSPVDDKPSQQQQDVISREDSVAAELRCIICFDHVKEYAFVPCGHLICCYECAKAQSECPVCRTPRTALLHVPGVGDESSVLCLCKHCGHVIEPSVFDGHREVCGLRMRQLRREEEEKAAREANRHPTLEEEENTHHGGGHQKPSSTLSSPHVGPSPKGNSPMLGPSTESTALLTTPQVGGTLGLCVKCKAVPRSTALMPCGHKLLCKGCSSEYTTTQQPCSSPSATGGTLNCPVCFRPVTSVLHLFDI